MEGAGPGPRQPQFLDGGLVDGDDDDAGWGLACAAQEKECVESLGLDFAPERG